ncbi:hypothetical protein D3C73_1595960 [compost metagenome]
MDSELVIGKNAERRAEHHENGDQGLEQSHALLQLIRMNMLLEQLHDGRLREL